MAAPSWVPERSAQWHWLGQKAGGRVYDGKSSISCQSALTMENFDMQLVCTQGGDYC
ncbi:uncharacterized protein ACLA_002150 [Aspergillus clavatus NRRL 1]|uniref:Uncharacterized protein n=1 Tax=Aspergillus clavatus (strain ATCC 1007 / CBS 513.65 / DSM 816 / NCTC 3887 / NRRL 1 / QM 1276 / 107) TaxID=344612 RepID=A1C536_ASPCL|nr:uncharacterized protein ACLA_002150 [Aspergillus clavatus NRRL 1]EAW14804.1 hypothetical protein ACLA_002150 [Aspergillus clavatus NRRL 1]